MGCQPAFTCSKLTKETLARCEICSKLLKKTSEQDHWRRTVICIVNFGHICCFVLGFLSLILNNLIPAGLNCHWPINAYHSKSAESQFSWKFFSRKGATSWLWFSTRLSWDIFFHPNMFCIFVLIYSGCKAWMFMIFHDQTKRQSCHHIETSQSLCSENRLTGFYMTVTLVFNDTGSNI